MSAHVLPDTDEVRTKLAAAQAENLALLGLDAHHIAVWEDGYRAHNDEASTFEWWYFDTQLDDGSTVVVTFSNKPHTDPSGPLKPMVLLIYHGVDGTKTRQTLEFPADQFAAATETCNVRIGPNTVTGNLDAYDLHVETDDLTVDLHLDRGAPCWRPGAGVSFFDSAKKNYLGWVVPVPYGTITGTITEKGVARAVTGSAYHDHNWGNKLMGDWLDHWYWGRAHIDDFTVVYVRMTTRGLFGIGAMEMPTFFLAKGDTLITDDILPLRLQTSGDVPGPGHQTYPTDLVWTWACDAGNVTMHVTNPALIEALDMTADMPAWKKPIVATFEHPMYYDFNADMELTIDIGDVQAHVSGRTLYEKMMFR